MFEDFPYTNFHDLNLDWIIQRIMDAYGPDNPPPVGLVLSVNGETGAVVLYKDQNVQLPSIDETSWNFFRIANESTEGLKFTKGQPMERVSGSNRYKVYDEGNPPPSGAVASVDGMTGAVKTWANTDYPTLQTPTAAPGTVWDLRRELANGDKVGIEFSYDATEAAYKAYLKYTPTGTNVPVTVELLTSANIPESGVISVNTKTGIVTLYGSDIMVTSSGSETLAAAITRLETAIAEKYTKPATGIPASDLAEGVIPDVSRFYVVPSGGIPASELAGNIPASKLASGVIPDVSIYQEKPSQTGTAGQVLGLDSSLNPVWITPSSGGADLSDLVRVETYNSVSDISVESGMKPGFNNTKFGISAISGYTPVAIVGVVCSSTFLFMADFNLANMTNGNNFIWFRSGTLGSTYSGSVTLSVLWIKTDAIHAEG